jgi:hypothetical protein
MKDFPLASNVRGLLSIRDSISRAKLQGTDLHGLKQLQQNWLEHIVAMRETPCGIRSPKR